MVDMKRIIWRRRPGQNDDAQWWVQDIEMGRKSLSAKLMGRWQKKRSRVRKHVDLRREEKVLSLTHFSWFHSSQAEGKGLRQLTFPEPLHQQNARSLSYLSSGPKHRVHGHLAILLWAPAGKGEERPRGHLELFSLAQGWQLSQNVISQQSIISTCSSLHKLFSLSQFMIISMSFVLYQL